MVYLHISSRVLKRSLPSGKLFNTENVNEIISEHKIRFSIEHLSTDKDLKIELHTEDNIGFYLFKIINHLEEASMYFYNIRGNFIKSYSEILFNINLNLITASLYLALIIKTVVDYDFMDSELTQEESLLNAYEIMTFYYLSKTALNSI